MKKCFLFTLCFFAFSCNAASIDLSPMNLWHTVSLRKIKEGKIVPTFLAEYLLKTSINSNKGETRPVRVICISTRTEMNLLIPLNEWNKFTLDEIKIYFPEVEMEETYRGRHLSPVKNSSIITINLTYALKALLNKERREINQIAKKNERLTRNQRIKQIEEQLSHLTHA